MRRQNAAGICAAMPGAAPLSVSMRTFQARIPRVCPGASSTTQVGKPHQQQVERCTGYSPGPHSSRRLPAARRRLQRSAVPRTIRASYSMISSRRGKPQGVGWKARILAVRCVFGDLSDMGQASPGCGKCVCNSVCRASMLAGQAARQRPRRDETPLHGLCSSEDCGIFPCASGILFCPAISNGRTGHVRGSLGSHL